MRSKGMLIVLALVALVGIGGCAGCSTYNGLVSEEEQVEQQWANLQSSYQRRADLVPNLVSTVRGAANFEQETLTQVTEARARATSINVSAEDLDDPQKIQQFQQAQQQLGGALGRLLAVSESYPQLRSTAAFTDLQTQLEGTENRINVARRDYNGAVRRYNTDVRQFPAALFAGIMGFDTRTPFEADPGAQDAPDVDFGG